MKIKKTTVATTTTKGNKASKATAAQKSAPAAAAVAAPERKASGANTGAKTGLRVMDFQDRTLETNDLAKRPAPLAHIPGQLSDDELAAAWRAEFPNSRAVQNGRITGEMVRSVRNLFNQGTGDHGTPGKIHTMKPWVIGEGGKRVQAEYSRVRKADATGNAPKAKASVPVTQAAKAAAKVVTAKAAQAVKASGKKVVVKSKKAA